MKSTLKPAVLIATFFIFITTMAFANVKNANGENDALFVVLAKHGKVHQVKGQKNEYMLTLKKVNPSVITFTATPYRFSKEVPLSQFVQQWTKGSFAKLPPNAVVNAVQFASDHHMHNQKPVVYTVMLNQPEYNAAKHTLSFMVKPINGNPMKIPNMGRSDYIALFIDNGCISCWGP